MKAPGIDAAVERIEGGDRRPLYLVIGEQVLAMREATRIAAALAASAGCEVAVHKGAAGAEVGSILADLCTFSLFEPAKVALVSECAVFADRDAAADLIDQTASVLDDEYRLGGEPGEWLSRIQGLEAGRLLQVLRLFGIDPFAGETAEAIAALPDKALSGGRNYRRGGRRGRLKKQREALASGLADLLEAARAEDLRGWSEGDLAELHRAAEGGLPEGHGLVFAERSADREHPIVRRLFESGAAFEVGTLGFDRNGRVLGLDPVIGELQRTTGVGIDRGAADELARRTLRKEGWGPSDAVASSVDRLSAEYLKLADGVRGRSNRIERSDVDEMVTDRGEEDMWEILNAIGEKGPAIALEQFRRFLDTAPDLNGALFPFFGALGGFCQHMTAIHGALARARVPAVYNFNAFKSRVLPQLKADLPESVAKVTPFRLFRAYQAARLRQGPEASRAMAELPWRVLETDVRLRGGSTDRVAAVESLVVTIASGAVDAAGRSGSSRGGRGRTGSFRRSGPGRGRPARRR